jgi:hypothetical protein
MMPGYAPSAKKRHQKRKIAAPFQRSSAQRMAKSACVPTTGGNPARGNRLAAVPLDRIELPAGLGRGGCRLRRRRRRNQGVIGTKYLDVGMGPAGLSRLRDAGRRDDDRSALHGSADILGCNGKLRGKNRACDEG